MKKSIIWLVALFGINASAMTDDKSEINSLLDIGIKNYEVCVKSANFVTQMESETSIEEICSIPVENGKDHFKKANELAKKQPKPIRDKLAIFLKKGIVYFNTYKPNEGETKLDYRRRLASNINTLKEMKAEIELDL